MSGRAASLLLLSLSLPVVGLAAEPPLDCARLKAVVAEAPDNFKRLSGTRVQQETAQDLAARLGVPASPVDPDHVRKVYAVSTPWHGADHCEVVDASSGDAVAAYGETAFVCRYNQVQVMPADLNARLARCLGKAPDADADGVSLAITVDAVESGEGYAGTQVTAHVHALEGLRLSVVQSRCLAKRQGGCGDPDE